MKENSSLINFNCFSFVNFIMCIMLMMILAPCDNQHALSGLPGNMVNELKAILLFCCRSALRIDRSEIGLKFKFLRLRECGTGGLKVV